MTDEEIGLGREYEGPQFHRRNDTSLSSRGFRIVSIMRVSSFRAFGFLLGVGVAIVDAFDRSARSSE